MKHISKASLGFGTLDSEEVWNSQYLTEPCSIRKHGYTYYASVNDDVIPRTLLEANRTPTPERDTLDWGCKKLAETVGQVYEDIVVVPNKPVDRAGMSSKLTCGDTGTVALLHFTPYHHDGKQWSFIIKASVLVTSSITPERLENLANDVLDVLRTYAGDAPQPKRHIVFFVHELRSSYPVSRNVLITGERQSGKTYELIASALAYARANPTKKAQLIIAECEFIWDKIYAAHIGERSSDECGARVIENPKAVIQALYPNLFFDLYKTRLFNNREHALNRGRGFAANALFINLLPLDTRYFKHYLMSLRTLEVETVVVDMDLMGDDIVPLARKQPAAVLRAGINRCVAYLNKCGLRQLDVVRPVFIQTVGRDYYQSFIYRGLGIRTDARQYHTVLVNNTHPLPSFVANLNEVINNCNENPTTEHTIRFGLITYALDNIDYYINYALQMLVGIDSDLLCRLAVVTSVQDKLAVVLGAKINDNISWCLELSPDGRGVRESDSVISYTLSPERPEHDKTLESWDEEIKYLAGFVKNKSNAGVDLFIPIPVSNGLLHLMLEPNDGSVDKTRNDILRDKVVALMLKYGLDAVVDPVVSRAGKIW